MPSFPFRRARVRAFSIISICAVLVTMASVLTSHPHAGASSAAGRHQSGGTLAQPDRNGITPEASTITVNSTSDVANSGDGLCTLREAITAANNNAPSGAAPGECVAGGFGSDTINITGVSGTITLSIALPTITSDMFLNGPGPNNLMIERNQNPGITNFTVFTVQSGTVNFSGFTVTGGGSGIFNAGALTLANVTVTNNQGGITNSGTLNGTWGTLTLINSTVSNNGADDVGGGIYVNLGMVTLINTTVSGNSNGLALDGGGVTTLILKNSVVSDNNGIGISNGGGALIINDSTIRNNKGSGISMGAGSMTMINSTVSGNTGIGGGGFVNGGGATLINSTISGNRAIGGFGGGIYNRGILSVVNCTVTGNTAATTGGGIYGNDFRSPAPTNLRNTIIAGNTAGSGPDLGGGGFISQDYNLIGNISGSIAGNNAHNITNVNALLGPLASNGGLVQTHALLPNSPALDAADNCVTQPAHCGDANIPQLTTDQRGFNRLVDGPDADTTATIDIGAYETQAPLANLTDVIANEDTRVLVPFDPGDLSTIASVTATSDISTLVPNDALHLSAAITGSTGIVTINPAANLFGTTNITVTVNRTGGGSEQRTFVLTVNSSNDAPTFTLAEDLVVNEDAGPQTRVNWATNLSPGPSDESTQTLNIRITGNTNPALFTVAPSISASGTLTFAAAPDANGSATITVTVTDNGGTANGGVDSTSRTFNITITPVNDVPAFTKGPDQTGNNNSGTRTVNNWATNISSGPANESAQTLTFQVTGNTNAALFAIVPAISSTGTLTYTPASNAGGSATITINLKDNGGTANGGVDTSASQSFTIIVTPVGGFISFAAAGSNTSEDSGSASVAVNRTGDTTRAVTVDYATNADNGLPCSSASGVATPKCDFTAALGTLNFAAGETVKTITVLISQDSFVEGPETITLTLSNQTNGSALAAPSTASITIADDVTEPTENLIDDVRNFVRQHYHDFLNREPDSGGWDFWMNQITSCGNDAQCSEVHRINVSASFFLSIEFQNIGYLVERFYKVGYGDAAGTSTFVFNHTLNVPIVRASEFLTDTQRIGRGVIVLQPGWEQLLENNKQAYALEFVQTTRFTMALPTTMTPSQFVTRLNQNTGGVLSLSERQAVIDLFGGSGNTSNVTVRAQAVRTVAEDQDLYNNEFNRAFVLAQYFGYLRRNPNDPQDTDYTGYDFWLTKLNQFNGNYVQAEMVKAFLSSIEYRQRFGP